jgi:hypothetical protein
MKDEGTGEQARCDGIEEQMSIKFFGQEELS